MINFLIISASILSVSLLVAFMFYAKEGKSKQEESLVEPIVDVSELKRYTGYEVDEWPKEALEKVNNLEEKNKSLGKALQRELVSKKIIIPAPENKDTLKKEKGRVSQDREKYGQELGRLNGIINHMKGESEKIDLHIRNMEVKMNEQSQKIISLDNEKQELKQAVSNQEALTLKRVSEIEELNQSLLSKLKEREENILSLREELKMRLESKTPEEDAVPNLSNDNVDSSKELTFATIQDGLAIIKRIRQEKETLLQEKVDRDLHFQKVKDLNDLLMEKDKILQYELTKSRAKAIGLEKIMEG